MEAIITNILVLVIVLQIYNLYLVYKAPTITAAEAKKLNKKEAVFLDVRTEQEYNQGHIPGAKNIPLNKLKSHLKEIPKKKNIIVVCASGIRSAKGTLQLTKAGFKDVKSLKGGIKKW